MATKTSEEYWRDRVTQEMKERQLQDLDIKNEYIKLHRRYLKNIENEINRFYIRYGNALGVSPEEMRKLADEMDVEDFATKVETYINDKNLSDEAKKELKVYNAKMRINRAELLSYHIDLEMKALAGDEYQLTEKYLNEEYVREVQRQAGILGEAVPEPTTLRSMGQAIINTPYKGAEWSENLWDRQEILSGIVADITQESLIKGVNATTFVKDLEKEFGVNEYQARRLAITEMARIQTAVQKDAYERNEFDQYEYIAEPTACPICAALDGKIFNTKDMMPGENATPMHPFCHCGTAPYMDREELNRMFEEYEKQLNGGIIDVEGNSLFRGTLKNHNLSRGDAIKKLQDEFDMSVTETSRTKLSEVALNQTYGILDRFKHVYNALPKKIPQVRAVPKSEAKDSIAWYSRYTNNNQPVEFGMNVKEFVSEEALQRTVSHNVNTGWFSKNAEPNHIMVHEFGHHLDFQLSEIHGESFSDLVIEAMINNYKDKYDINTLAKETGGYAYAYYNQTRKHTETFAELFAEAYGTTPREIADDFRKELERIAEEGINNVNGT